VKDMEMPQGKERAKALAAELAEAWAWHQLVSWLLVPTKFLLSRLAPAKAWARRLNEFLTCWKDTSKKRITNLSQLRNGNIDSANANGILYGSRFIFQLQGIESGSSIRLEIVK
jgi:hypothetical protein